MRRILTWLALILFALTSFAKAQSTAITLQVTDTDGQAWWNGSYTVQLYDPTAVKQGPWNINGTDTPVPNQSQKGALDAGGAASFTVTPNSVIVPSGSIWQLNVCAIASSHCYRTSFIAVGSTHFSRLAASSSPVMNPFLVKTDRHE